MAKIDANRAAAMIKASGKNRTMRVVVCRDRAGGSGEEEVEGTIGTRDDIFIYAQYRTNAPSSKDTAGQGGALAAASRCLANDMGGVTLPVTFGRIKLP